ncbi:MAG: phenylalanine--tRNA ligase subunit beta [Thermodesulfobacteriota bacterium]|nr:phenylalanine--tRNA ligase subunit beta [Thermodesulfobacteriota bacterium]
MKVSLSWLKQYISVDSAPSEMAAKLTMAGLEVESYSQIYNYLDHVVVGRVEKCEKHPRADKLSCCSVNVGEKEVAIVCGAPNVKKGMNVSCALPGAVLPGEFKIKKSKLRGEVSEGMLCSAAELKLNSDTAGIMDLDSNLLPGTPLVEALGLSDYMFDIDLTPNRPDCLSMIGVAREIAVFQEKNADITIPDAEILQDKLCDVLIEDLVKVDIFDPDLCPGYAAGLLVDVKVKPSPFWLRQRLESVGMASINNIVDITNFVMMETGQPLHAFDYDLLTGGRIEVKRAGSETKFTTLDEKEHKLEPDMLMICDGEKSVALAGVMGGMNSEISENTTRVLVESAYFNPVSVRKTARKTGIATDASHRFERGVDPRGTKKALVRALTLMAKVSDASIAKGIIDQHSKKSERIEIKLNTDALNRRLGTDLSLSVIQEILESVEFKVIVEDEKTLKVEVPSFRVDVLLPEDLSEEVARLWGYDNIKTSFPAMPARQERLSPKIILRDRVKDIMKGYGFSEAVNYSFTSPDSCDKLNLAGDDERRSIEAVLNPISEDLAVLRTSLIPGLLENMKQNVSKQVETLRLFETGNVFFAIKKGLQPKEREMIAGLWTGASSENSWHSKKVECDFFDIKGAVEGLFQALDVGDLNFSRASEEMYPYFKKGYAAVIKKDGRVIGSVGQIDPLVLKNFSLKQNAFVFDIDMSFLLEIVPQSTVSSPLPKYPSISRDITIIVDCDVEAGDVHSSIKVIMEKESLIEDVFLFDLYQGDSLAAGKKSLSFRVVYRSFEKTLKEKKIKGLHSRISKILVDKFKADLPS